MCSRPSDYKATTSRLEFGAVGASGAAGRLRHALAVGALDAASVVLVQLEAAPEPEGPANGWHSRTADRHLSG